MQTFGSNRYFQWQLFQFIVLCEEYIFLLKMLIKYMFLEIKLFAYFHILTQNI
jgi:hypothetical protein